MSQVLVTSLVTNATKQKFRLGNDDYEYGTPALRAGNLQTGDSVTLWTEINGVYESVLPAVTLSPTVNTVSLPHPGSYATTMTMVSRTQATFTCTVTTGACGTLVTSAAGKGYLNGTGFTYTIPGGNNNAVITYNVVSNAISGASITTPGTGYTPNGAGYAVTGFPAPPPLAVEIETSGSI